MSFEVWEFFASVCVIGSLDLQSGLHREAFCYDVFFHDSKPNRIVIRDVIRLRKSAFFAPQCEFRSPRVDTHDHSNIASADVIKAVFNILFEIRNFFFLQVIFHYSTPSTWYLPYPLDLPEPMPRPNPARLITLTICSAENEPPPMY